MKDTSNDYSHLLIIILNEIADENLNWQQNLVGFVACKTKLIPKKCLKKRLIIIYINLYYSYF